MDQWIASEIQRLREFTQSQELPCAHLIFYEDCMSAEKQRGLQQFLFRIPPDCEIREFAEKVMMPLWNINLGKELEVRTAGSHACKDFRFYIRWKPRNFLTK